MRPGWGGTTWPCSGTCCWPSQPTAHAAPTRCSQVVGVGWGQGVVGWVGGGGTNLVLIGRGRGGGAPTCSSLVRWGGWVASTWCSQCVCCGVVVGVCAEPTWSGGGMCCGACCWPRGALCSGTCRWPALLLRGGQGCPQVGGGVLFVIWVFTACYCLLLLATA